MENQVLLSNISERYQNQIIGKSITYIFRVSGAFGSAPVVPELTTKET
jgi:hypothetical protein